METKQPSEIHRNIKRLEIPFSNQEPDNKDYIKILQQHARTVNLLLDELAVTQANLYVALDKIKELERQI